MADLQTVKIRDLIETTQVMTTDYMVLEKDTGTFKCQARYLKGATGLTPNVQVGNTTTLAPGQLATVTQRGNTENPVFDFGIPQGVQGQIGPQGPKGDTPSIAPLQTQIDNRFNALTSQQQGSSEVIEARGGYPALKARLDAINDDLIKYNDQTIVTHTTENNFSSIDATKNGYLDNILLEGKTLVVDSNNQVVLPGTQGSILKSVGDDVNEIKLNSINKNLLDKKVLESIATTVIPKIVNNGFEVDYSNVISIPYYPMNINNNSYLNLEVIKKGSADILVRGYLNLEDMKASRNFVFSKGLSSIGKASEITIPSNTKYIAFQRGSSLTGLVQIDNISITTVSNNLFVEHIKNTKKVLYKDTDGTWKKPILRQWDSIEKHSDGKYYYHKRSDIRNYQSGDETNSNVITDKTNTVYRLNNEVVYECTQIDLISYDTQTNYSIECGPIYPKTTLKVNSYLGNVVSILKDKVSYLENMLVDGLKLVVAGNMQELAYQLYPQDFVDNSVNMEVIK